LTQSVFVEIYDAARKLSPARFLTLKMHPKKYLELFDMALPASVQMGDTTGPLGKRIVRVVCVKLPQNVEQGVAIEQDAKMDQSKLIFEIHGIPELVVENLA